MSREFTACFFYVFDGFRSYIQVFNLIHFDLIFVYGVRQWSSFILLHMAVQLSWHNLLKRLSFHIHGPFVVN